jgi:hypothetical protein
MQFRMLDLCIIFRNSSGPKVQPSANRLIDNLQYFLTFLKENAVQPSNNASEKTIRPEVLGRKSSFFAYCKLSGANAYSHNLPDCEGQRHRIPSKACQSFLHSPKSTFQIYS